MTNREFLSRRHRHGAGEFGESTIHRIGQGNIIRDYLRSPVASQDPI
jgi:hypothetical protein